MNNELYVTLFELFNGGGGGGGGVVSTPTCRVLGKSLLFLGNISIFGDSGKRMKLRDEDKILGRNGKCINYMEN